jgi:hypothetical protein
MPPLATQVPPRNADDAKERAHRIVALPGPVLDLHIMLDAATETPATPAASAPATDELLSQLAGKEIDRLLSDAGLEPSATTADATHSDAATGAAPDVTKDTATTATTTIAADVAAAPGAEPPAARINNELDQIVARQLNEAARDTEEKSADPVATEAGAPAADAPATKPTGEADAAGVGDLLNRLDAGERAPAPAQPPESPDKAAEPGPA